MADHHVGALLVMKGEVLAGIVSERDYAGKVILRGRSSSATPGEGHHDHPGAHGVPDTRSSSACSSSPTSACGTYLWSRRPLIGRPDRRLGQSAHR